MLVSTVSLYTINILFQTNTAFHTEIVSSASYIAEILYINLQIVFSHNAGLFCGVASYSDASVGLDIVTEVTKCD